MSRPASAPRTGARRDGPIATPITSRLSARRKRRRGDPLVRPFRQHLSRRIERPAGDLPDRAKLAQSLRLLPGDDAVLHEGGRIADRADADETDVGALGEVKKALHRGEAGQELALLDRAGDDRQRHRIVRRAHAVGHANDDVVERSRTIGLGGADQRDQLVLRAFHRRQLVGDGAHRAAGADADDRGLRTAQPAFEFRRGDLGDAERRRCRGRIGRGDFAEPEVVTQLERRGELHAARDRMIEPDLDQPLADRQRNQALRRLARNAELARDLVLGVAGDVIEPSGAGGLVEPQTVMIRFARHGFSPRPEGPLGPPARRRGRAAAPYRRR